jgi:acetyl-CoA carboxylase carboxyltransferase component
MGAEGAIDVVFGKQIRASEDPDKARHEALEGYRQKLYNPYTAAKLGYVTDVIFRNETRQKLISAIEISSRKQESLPDKKHGNIPL